MIGEKLKLFEKGNTHHLVATEAAIAEYLCLATITIFSLSEWTDLWDLNIMAEDNGIDIREVDECCLYSSCTA